MNQNQTFRHEIAGEYLWSPKRKSDGHRNHYYETMREVAPGDLVFSFYQTRLGAFGIARSYAYEAPKPEEFAEAGRNWNAIGWRVDVGYHKVLKSVRPADWMELLRPLLPPKYAPLLADGRGIQSVYLTELTRTLALALADLVGSDVGALARTDTAADASIRPPSPELFVWEEHLRDEILRNPAIQSTEKEALVIARRGQGLFRERVQRIETRCRITGVTRPEHLRASHCKPWRDCSNEERLNGENGLLLTPSIDHLFDRGFISFRDDGRLLVSPVAHKPSLARMGVEVERSFEAGTFSERQSRFLEYHRDAVFLKSQVKPTI